MMQGGWIYVVIVASILTAGLFIWLEYRRPNKRFLLGRVMAVIVAVGCLACIVLPLKYNGEHTKADSTATILLTNGFDADSIKVDSNTVTMDKNIAKKYPKARLITGIDDLKGAGQLQVYGYGLTIDELAQLDSMPLTFHPSKKPAGVSSISWPETLNAGEVFRVQGLYNNTSTQKVKLVLTGLNTGLDSVTLPPNAQTPFELTTTPKAAGKMAFTLKADTVLQGTLPVQVQPLKPLSVLMLWASPDFESRFLKNWLSQNGYRVALRSAISKDKYNTEYINLDRVNLNNLSSATFQKFDVIIGDLQALNNLTTGETGALKQEVEGDGLGVIVRADSSSKTSWLQRQFPVDRPSGKGPAPAALIINGKKSNSTNLSYSSAHVIYREGTQPLVKTINNHELAGVTLAGSGKIIFTTLNNTFSWALGGYNSDYSALWSALISKAARKNNEVRRGVTFSNLPVVNAPVNLQFTAGNHSAVNINGKAVSPMQNPHVPFEWDVTFRPSVSGWQTLQQGGTNSSWYAYGTRDWEALQAAEKIAATSKYASAYNNSPIVTKPIQQKVRIDVPKIYFYILLLAACTFLWIEAKF